MKATLKMLTGKGDKAKTVPVNSTLPSCGDGGSGAVLMAASAGDAKSATPKERASRKASSVSSSSSCGSSSSSNSSSSSSSGNSNSELCSFAQSSCASKQPEAMRHRFKRPDSPRVLPPSGGSHSSSSDNNNSSSSSSSSIGDSASCSVPESEAFWSELPALKPLINPGRLQALRLCSRDHRVQDGGDATIMASPTSPLQLASVCGSSHQLQQQHQQQPQQQPQQQQQQNPSEASTHQSQQTLAGSQARPDCNQCNRRGSPGASAAEASTRRSGKSTQDEAAAACGRSELKLAESASCPRNAIYQYSFRVPDTKANMRAFTDPTDRRVEAIARASDSEILLDPEPIRAASSMRLRRVTIRAPDPHSLEKCCRMFDDKFPHFYVSGGLGPGGRCVSKIYDDGDEKYISASNDEWSCS